MNTDYWTNCRIVCWGIAIVIGLVVFAFTREPTSGIAALMLGLALAVFLGLILARLICSDERRPAAAQPGEMKQARAEPPARPGTPPDVIAGMAETAPKPNPPTPNPPKPNPPKGTIPEPVRPAPTPLSASVAAEQEAGEASQPAPAVAEATPEAAAAPAPAAKAETKPAQDSGDGTRPEALDGPRGGKADNLKEIKGIGPKLEELCHSLGFYHFDQIASWSADEVAWVDDNLKGFKGRVSRDEWVAQARILAEGGETEFSKRVEDGDVY